ncbi:MAG: DUF2080 family transposase-associated protein [Deltaproteobacteria bacterium]|nr:DUF2080 family transposase-associated protein [Deltaproteobacteria bacterium]
MTPNTLAFNKRSKNKDKPVPIEAKGSVRLEIYGEEVVERVVKLSGNSGRVYLPMVWVGCRVKVVRLE